MPDEFRAVSGETFFSSSTTENGLTSYHYYDEFKRVFRWEVGYETARLSGYFTPEELIGIAREMLLRSATKGT